MTANSRIGVATTTMTAAMTMAMRMVAAVFVAIAIISIGQSTTTTTTRCHAFVVPTHRQQQQQRPRAVVTRTSPTKPSSSVPSRLTTTSTTGSLNLSLLSYDSWINAVQQLHQAVPTNANNDDGLLTMTTWTEKWSFLAHYINQLSPMTNPELPLLQKLVLLGPVPLAFLGHMYTLSFPRRGYRDGLEPYPRGKYDPDVAASYYEKHPTVVIQRFLEVMRLSNHWLFGLVLDKYVFNNEQEMRQQRAEELVVLITQLGTTAIKVGQALSVRSDLLPEEYITALTSLQDQVPAFDNTQAKQVLVQQLGRTKCKELLGINEADGPIASASIGQVYKAKVRKTNNNDDDGYDVLDIDINHAGKDYDAGDDDDDDGNNFVDVAVKVQRPNVLSEIALDLYLVRQLAPFYQKYIARSQTDLQSLVNEWGRGFIAELDYRDEAKKTMEFNQAMADRNLNAVTAPTVLPEYSSERILVTEWVDGTRIDKSHADDIPRLCSVALNAYLVMLLDLGSLHCDPHPGNLLRTKDGRLCILDFGMTLNVDPNLQYSLLEYIAHCSSDNYDKLPEDMVNLGFLREDMLEFAKRSGLLEPLVYFLQEIGKGGGVDGVRTRLVEDYRSRYPGMTDDELRDIARAEMETQMIDMVEKESLATGITVEVEELQRQNQDAFSIPDWFVYTSRAFMTLEGVSLQADPGYSLIQSCFPYIAKRLVRDNSPRAQKALKEMLYGAGDSVNFKRLGALANGFSTYTTTTKSVKTGVVDAEVDGATSSNKKRMEAEVAITLAKDSAEVLFDPTGNLVQNLLMEEGALAASAQVKDDLKRLFVDAPQQFRDSIPMGMGMFLPKLPVEDSIAPFIKKTATEEKALRFIAKLRQIITDRSNEFRSKSVFAPGGMPFGTVGGAEQHMGDPIQRSTATAAADIQSSVNALVGEIEPEQAALIVRELRENLPKYSHLLGLLGTKFVAMLLQKASNNIDVTLVEIQQRGDPLLLAAAKGLSTAGHHVSKSIYQPPITKEEQEEQVIAVLQSTQG